MQFSTSTIPQFAVIFTIIAPSFIFGSSISLNPLMSIPSMQCDSPNSPICLNGGACLDLSKFLNKPEQKPQMSCYCPKKYFGPHCEYASKESFSKIDRSVRRRPLKQGFHSKRGKISARILPKMKLKLRTKTNFKEERLNPVNRFKFRKTSSLMFSQL